MPLQRNGSAVPQFVRRIPTDVRSKAIGRILHVPVGPEIVRIEIKDSMTALRFSLRTKDKHEAKHRETMAAAYLEGFWRALRREEAVSLSHKQAVALAGEIYRGWTERSRREYAVERVPGTSILREARATPEDIIAGLEDAIEKWRNDPDRMYLEVGKIVDAVLLRHGIAWVDAASLDLLHDAFLQALIDAAETLKRNYEGDYSPDPKALRFPKWTPMQSEVAPVEELSMTQLVEDWWREAKAAGRKPSTYESYKFSFTALSAFLGHDDARRVTTEDVIKFKDHRLSTPSPKTGKIPSAKTVKDSDLTGLKAVFGWAVANRKLPSNPATGVTIKVGKQQRLRSKGFTDKEAKALLKAARNFKPGNERPWTAAAKKWVPWLCAYTGARVGEIAQLRKEDVRSEEGHWVIRITPEAGTVKSNEARSVVLHPHLVDVGFVDFAVKAPKGHLFLRPAEDGDVLGPLQGTKNRLAEFAREVVPDPNVAPNHGWRHRFKTIGREVGIDPRIVDAIQGHAPKSVADDYGDVTVSTIARAIAKIPRVEVEP